MSGSMTARDRVWSAIVQAHNSRLDVSEVRRQIRRDDIDEEPPNDETIKRVLRAATELGVLDHMSGSPYWDKSDAIRSRWPVRS
jgi:hypothetical protein